MTLSDYDTSVEKIAALKAAILDPALCNIVQSSFIASENIFVFRIVNSNDWSDYYGNYNFQGIWFNSGENITISIGYSCLYIKDDDIVYSDPITTYQNRLATILSIIPTKTTTNITTGAYGSIILTGDDVSLTGIANSLLYNNDAQQLSLPIPSNTQLSLDTLKYFDVPADW